MHGNGTVNSAWKSQLPRSTNASISVVDESPHLLVEGDEVACAQLRIHDPAVLGVVGRVDLQRDQRAVLADVDGPRCPS